MQTFSPFAADTGFRPEAFFAGKTRGNGFFQDSLGIIRREFVVDIEGSVSDGVLTLEEDFRYDDGAVEHRSWEIRRISRDAYEGRTADVPGVARGILNGRKLSWRYDFWLRMAPNQRVLVRFDDLMVAQGHDVMINRARMRKLGVLLGTVFLCFRKLDHQEI